MNIDTLVSRFIERGQEEEIRRSIEEYLDIPITLKISDEPMRRICQVLTDNRYITTDSCDGHATDHPTIFLRCDDQDHLRHLAYILCSQSGGTNFSWQLNTYSSSPGSNPHSHLYYILEPSQKVEIIPARDYEKLLQDLDIIGICVMSYFNEEQAFLDEEATAKKAKEERDLRKVSERIEELDNIFASGPRTPGMPIKPQVAYLWDGEPEDFQEKGGLVEEFIDGFERETAEKILRWQHPFENYQFMLNEGYLLRQLVCDEGLMYSFPVKKLPSEED